MYRITLKKSTYPYTMEIFDGDGTGVKDPKVGKLQKKMSCVIQAKGPLWSKVEGLPGKC